MDRLAPDGLSWVPSRRVFVRRVLLNGALTYLALVVVMSGFLYWMSLPTRWGFVGAAFITLGFFLEDMMRWRRTRDDLWQIHEGMLIHDSEEGRSQVPLSEIHSVTAQIGNRVSITLITGLKIPMRYLSYPKEIADQINRARRGPVGKRK
ncbi:MAG: hypothetical protein ABJL67_00530 [Sulfitobacter sp.]